MTSCLPVGGALIAEVVVSGFPTQKTGAVRIDTDADLEVSSGRRSSMFSGHSKAGLLLIVVSQTIPAIARCLYRKHERLLFDGGNTLFTASR